MVLPPLLSLLLTKRIIASSNLGSEILVEYDRIQGAIDVQEEIIEFHTDFTHEPNVPWHQMVRCPGDAQLAAIRLAYVKWTGIIHGTGDKTDDVEVNGVEVKCKDLDSETLGDARSVIYLEYGDVKGHDQLWSDWTQCPEGQQLIGLDVKEEDPYVWIFERIDKVGTTGIKLICETPPTEKAVRSTHLVWDSTFGEHEVKTCSHGRHVCGLAGRGLPYQHGWHIDNKGVEGIRILCCSATRNPCQMGLTRKNNWSETEYETIIHTATREACALQCLNPYNYPADDNRWNVLPHGNCTHWMFDGNTKNCSLSRDAPSVKNLYSLTLTDRKTDLTYLNWNGKACVPEANCVADENLFFNKVYELPNARELFGEEGIEITWKHCASYCAQTIGCNTWRWEGEHGLCRWGSDHLTSTELIAGGDHDVSGSNCNGWGSPIPYCNLYNGTIEKDTEYIPSWEGHQFMDQIEDDADCARLCLSMPTCHFWTYDHKYKHCRYDTVKSSESSSPNANTVSSARCLNLPWCTDKPSAPGKQLLKLSEKPIAAKDWKTCNQLCIGETPVNCAYWSYDVKNQECYLGLTFEKEQVQQGFMSGEVCNSEPSF